MSDQDFQDVQLPSSPNHNDYVQFDYIGDLKKARVLCDKSYKSIIETLDFIEEIYSRDPSNNSAKSIKTAFQKVFPSKDALIEARMWLLKGMSDLSHDLPEEYRDEYVDFNNIPSQS